MHIHTADTYIYVHYSIQGFVARHLIIYSHSDGVQFYNILLDFHHKLLIRYAASWLVV